MKLSVIIPCYNEIKNVPLILKKVEEVVLIKSMKREIIIIDDGSTDGSKEYIKNKVSNKIKKIYHKKNRGKGAALRTGIKYATGDIILFQDADLELNPQEYNKLILPIINGDYDVVYGSRFLNQHKASSIAHLLGNLFLTFATRVLYGADITDMETCYKIFKKEIIQNINLNSDDFNIEPEITAKILKMGIKIKEISITYNPRSTKEGKKMKWRYGLGAIWTLLYWRLKN